MTANTIFSSDDFRTRESATDPILAPLPHRPVYWGRALRAMWKLRYAHKNGLDFEDAHELGIALEGNDNEIMFQEFLAGANAARLMGERPKLWKLLDDHAALAELPTGSLGRAYLAMAKRDGVEITPFVEGVKRRPEEELDELRDWFDGRGIAVHDLEHLLTDYQRDVAGEAAVAVFDLAQRRRLIRKVILFMALQMAPKRRLLPVFRYLRAAWKRGLACHIPCDTVWEDLLRLPIDEVRQSFGIAPTREVHPEGAWQVMADGEWAPV